MLARRTFPPPHTAGMVEPGYRDAPAAEEQVAFVYVNVRVVGVAGEVWAGVGASPRRPLAVVACQQLTLRPPHALFPLTHPHRAQVSKPAEVLEAEQVRPAVSDDTIIRWVARGQGGAQRGRQQGGPMRLRHRLACPSFPPHHLSTLPTHLPPP